MPEHDTDRATLEAAKDAAMYAYCAAEDAYNRLHRQVFGIDDYAAYFAACDAAYYALRDASTAYTEAIKAYNAHMQH